MNKHSKAIDAIQKEINNLMLNRNYYRKIIRSGKRPSGVYGTKKQQEKMHRDYVVDSKNNLKYSIETVKELKKSLKFLNEV